MRTQDRLVLPNWAPWLVLLPLAVIAADTLFHWAFGWHDPVKQVVSATANERAEAAGRTRVLAAMLPFLLVATVITLNFIREYLTVFGPRTRRRLLIPILAFAAGAIGVMAMQLAGISPPEEIVGSNFMATAFAKITVREGVPLMTALQALLLIFRVALIVGAGAVIAGTISCLAVPEDSLPPRRQQEYRAMQRRRLDGYLYASALLLVSGLFFIDACMRWAAPFSTQPAQYTEHINALMLADGILYSTIIASYYVPAALWMRRLSADLPAAAGEAAAAAPGGDVSPPRVIKAFLALIAPAVAGVLTQLLEGVGL
jgi:hypothetical protein